MEICLPISRGGVGEGMGMLHFDDAIEKISDQVRGVPSLAKYVVPFWARSRARKQIPAASSTWRRLTHLEVLQILPFLIQSNT